MSHAPSPDRPGGRASRRDRAQVLFAYGGIGSTWPGMGRSLLAEPTAASFLQRCERLMAEMSEAAGWSLIAELSAGKDVSRLADPAIAQPALFCMQAALTEVWRAWGLEPDMVAGMSVGEIAAAYAARVFDLETALRVALSRGRAVATARGLGCSVAVALPAQDVASLITPEDRVWVSVLLGPDLTLASGTRDSVTALTDRVRRHGGRWEMRNPDHPFHCPLMQPAQGHLFSALGDLALRNPDRPIFSSLNGAAAPNGAYGPPYWAETLVSPVQAQGAVLSAAADGPITVVEISPRALMTEPIRKSLARHPHRATVLPSMRAHRPAYECLLSTVGELRSLGYELDGCTTPTKG
ncbi:acyltransferase domain-containing protein [Thermomonospora umbrina]|uniref:Acyl transferase family protein n=1 Tax=Thermomonospora umbrina TaxID=111806 RepID=A0A3D9T5J2_9ACTN|nr:acyltransferase domain-containing protein [Thermomonospora umbrina]REE99974.1 acyl transferase family protein [Thermomonospora umbrina]